MTEHTRVLPRVLAAHAPGVAEMRADFTVHVVAEAELEAAMAVLSPAVAQGARAARFRGRPADRFTWTQERPGGEGKAALCHHLLVGAGSSGDAATARVAAWAGVKAALAVGAQVVLLELGHLGSTLHAHRLVELVATACTLATYRYAAYLSGDAAEPSSIRTIFVAGLDAGLDAAEFEVAARRGAVVGQAIHLARDLANGPAERVTPRHVAQEVVALVARLRARGAEVSCEIFDADACAARKMGAFLAVGRGSAEPVAFVHARYRPPGANKRLCLVGKGVTFDSGGYSLKPTDGMLGMKLDMHGAATVFAAFEGIARLQLPVEVHAISALCENMIGPNAYRLGDVLVSASGKTIEINNTDAEGRLTLADSLDYAVKLEPDALVDVATLTGACAIALGPHIAGLMARDDSVAQGLLQAASTTGEQLWRLPLPLDLMFMLESKIADLRNTGERNGGALTAGLFLSQFVPEAIPWAHLDIAGPGMCTRPFDVNDEGGTGYGVATLIQFATAIADRG